MDKKILIGIVIIAALLLIIPTSAYDVTVGGTSYKFNYRQQFNLSGNAVWGGDQSNYVYWIDVKNGTGTANATNGTTFLNDHASQFTTAAKWADCIITNSTGTPIKQWADTGLGTSTYARIYFNATTIAKSSNTTFYLYYGNTTVSSQQNGNATFNWFDDFEDNTVNGWAAGAGYTVAASTVSVGASGHAMNVTKASDGWSYSTFNVPISFTVNKSYEFELRPMQTGKQFTIGPSYGATNANLVVYGPREDGKIEAYWDSTTHDGTNFNLGQWYRLRGDVYNMSNYKTYLDGSLHSSGLDKVLGSCTNLNTFQLMLYYGSSNCQVTNVFIRDWAKGDPTIGNIKAEETDSITAPVANFGVTVNQAFAPLNVTFTDLSTNTPTSWAWNMGDGAANETTQNPTHVYTPYIGNTTTTYNTTLSAANAAGTGVKFVQANVTEYTLSNTMNSNISAGNIPLIVSFTSTYGNGTASGWNWSFGDGTYGTTRNVTHTYNSSGTYAVICNATNVYGYNWTRNVSMITAYNLSASFTQDKTTLVIPGSVMFNDTSVGSPTSWLWQWGDHSELSGDTNSTFQNGTHLFTEYKYYTVNLTVSNAYGSNKSANTIIQGIPPAPVAAFSKSPAGGTVPQEIHFLDNTEYAYAPNQTQLWQFGDGTANSTEQSPYHTFTTAGVFTVNITACSDGGCNKSASQTVTITDAPPVADFSTVVNQAYMPVNITFTNKSTGGTPTMFNWSFGDGTGNVTTADTSHVYTNYIANNTVSYNTTFTAANSGGSSTKFVQNNVTVYPITANFSADALSGVAPKTITFTEANTNGTVSGRNWSFGDGSYSSDTNPSHQYTVVGNYTVRLNATNVYGYGWIQKIGYINITAPIVADFNGTPLVGTGYANFNDLSTGDPTSWQWNWGDGSGNSTFKNPGHTFPAGTGLYTITMTASKTGSTDTKQRASYIQVYGYPIANFTANLTSGYNPLSVYFNDTSSGTGAGTMFNWSWGDGTANGTSRNMSHTYTTSGTYTVNFTSANPMYTDSISKSNYITVNTVPSTADFTSNVSSGYPAFNALFTDLSTNAPTTWNWSFGDGTGNATTQNVTHQYASWIGNTSTAYTTTLTVTNAGGTSTKSVASNVTAYPLTSTMTSNLSSGKPPLVVQFNTTFGNGTASAWSWNFGDGNTSTTRNATNTFSTVGTFPVILNASNTYSYNWQRNATMIAVNPLTPPVASFTANTTSGKVSLIVAFTDTSTNTPTGWLWQWGDGTANGTTQSPVHTFTVAGTYQANLTASNADGSNKSANTAITVNPLTPPVAAFSKNLSSGKPPLSIQFTDESTNTPTGWVWQWGDGTANGTTASPIHTFTVAGTYQVNLTASNADGSNMSANKAVTVNPLTPPVSSFTTNKTSGKIPVSIQFTDGSTNTPTSWLWQWDDGTANTTTQSPIHTFTVAGTYHVNLTSTNADGANKSADTTITAEALVPPVTNFTGNVTSGYIPFNVLFTDSSTNTPTSWEYSFGDGTANGTTQNPIHPYTVAGTYTVILTATNADGSGTLQRTNYIIANTPGSPVIPDFHANTTSGIYPLDVGFTDDSTNSPDTWEWNFGDGGANATTQNPSHTYTSDGSYTVVLTAINSTWGGGTKERVNYITVTVPVKPVAAFHSNKTVGYVSYNILFTDDSTSAPTGWQWSWGDATANGTTQNPIHSYSAIGLYTVTLTATNADGSGTMQKVNYIHIIATPTLIPFPGYVNVPQDLNGDGFYEDVNGNGRFDFADINIFFVDLAWAQLNEPIPAYDFNGNGRIDFKDVVLMFQEKW